MEISSLIRSRLAVFFQPETTWRTTSPPSSGGRGSHVSPYFWMCPKTAVSWTSSE